MSQYRDKNIEEQMQNIGLCLTAIEAQELDNLSVGDILAENRKDCPEMSLEEATMIGMKRNAREALLRAMAVATSFDRAIAMINDMAQSMDEKEGTRYKNRLEILLDFNKMIKDLSSARG